MAQIFVLGSINMDLVARVTHFPAPGETVQGLDFKTYPGGKGLNQAIAAAKLGTRTHMLGAVGSDSFGKELQDYLKNHTISVDGVSKLQGSTGTAIILVNQDGENQIVVIGSANADLSFDTAQFEVLTSDDFICAQFEIPMPVIDKAFALAKTKQATTLLNPAPFKAIAPQLLKNVDYLIVNEIEFSQCIGVPLETIDKIEDLIKSHFSSFPIPYLVVTLGEKGVMGMSKEEFFHIPSLPVTVKDTTGAGDCFVGALSYAINDGMSFEAALGFANKAAALSVTRRGAAPSMPSRSMIEG